MLKIFDKVKNPEHYTDGKYECFEVMKDAFSIEEVLAFCKLNAFKYIWRAGKKGNRDEDIAKANWYLDKYTKIAEENKIVSE